MLSRSEIRDIFSTGFGDYLAEAAKKFRDNPVLLQRAIFLSWYCSLRNCGFCYMSGLKAEKKAKRALWRVVAEAELCRAIGWEVEFLSAGYGALTPEEARLTAELVALATRRRVWLNIGYLSREELKEMGEAVGGVSGSVETLDGKIRQSIVPGKPLSKIEEMLTAARELDMKTGITVILGLGEDWSMIYDLLSFIEKHELSRVVFYPLKPQPKTRLAHMREPPSVYTARFVLATKLSFPEVEVIYGSWVSGISGIALHVLSGADGLTKFPLFALYGTKEAWRVEDEVRSTGRRLLGSFTRLSLLTGEESLEPESNPYHLFGEEEFSVSREAERKYEELKPKIQEAKSQYVQKVLKRLKAKV